MEILKKVSLSAAIITIGFSNLNSQNDSTIRLAFKSSYYAEAQYKYSKAIEDINKVYSASSYEMNLRLGWLNYENKKLTESVSYYQKAIDLMPMSIEAKLGMVYPLAALEKWDAVIDQYKAILKIDEYHSTVNYRLALIYYNRADYTNAWKYIEKYINIYPFDYDGTSLAGWIKYKEGKKDAAKALFEKALLMHPDDATLKTMIK